jgi:hypothetical protein
LFAIDDFLFVPAGIEHRFEYFTDDLVARVIFYGPVRWRSFDDGKRRLNDSKRDTGICRALSVSVQTLAFVAHRLVIKSPTAIA